MLLMAVDCFRPVILRVLCGLQCNMDRDQRCANWHILLNNENFTKSMHINCQSHLSALPMLKCIILVHLPYITTVPCVV